jgi:hypothetical protein
MSDSDRNRVKPLPDDRLSIRPTVFRVPNSLSHFETTLLVAVMMPFCDEFSPVYVKIEEACRSQGFVARRADDGDVWRQPEFIQDIFTLLCQADLVIIDCSFSNANVMYELGIAHTLGKIVVPIARDVSTDLASDFRHHRVIPYDPNNLSELRDVLSQKLEQYRRDHLTLRDAFGLLDTKPSSTHLRDAFGALDWVKSEVDMWSQHDSTEHSEWKQACSDLRDCWNAIPTRRQTGDNVADVMSTLVHKIEHVEATLRRLLENNTTQTALELDYHRRSEFEWLDRIFRSLVFGALNAWRPEMQEEPRVTRVTIQMPPIDTDAFDQA